MTKISKMLIYDEYLKKMKILVINHIIICKAVKIFYQLVLNREATSYNFEGCTLCSFFSILN